MNRLLYSIASEIIADLFNHFKHQPRFSIKMNVVKYSTSRSQNFACDLPSLSGGDACRQPPQNDMVSLQKESLFKSRIHSRLGEASPTLNRHSSLTLQLAQMYQTRLAGKARNSSASFSKLKSSFPGIVQPSPPPPSRRRHRLDSTQISAKPNLQVIFFPQCTPPPPPLHPSSPPPLGQSPFPPPLPKSPLPPPLRQSPIPTPIAPQSPPPLSLPSSSPPSSTPTSESQLIPTLPPINGRNNGMIITCSGDNEVLPTSPREEEDGDEPGEEKPSPMKITIRIPPFYFERSAPDYSENSQNTKCNLFTA